MKDVNLIYMIIKSKNKQKTLYFLPRKFKEILIG